MEPLEGLKYPQKSEEELGKLSERSGKWLDAGVEEVRGWVWRQSQLEMRKVFLQGGRAVSGRSGDRRLRPAMGDGCGRRLEPRVGLG